jgi:hypothetical protein
MANVPPDAESDAAFLAAEGLEPDDLLTMDIPVTCDTSSEATVLWEALLSPKLRCRTDLCDILGIPSGLPASKSPPISYRTHLTALYGHDPDLLQERFCEEHPLVRFCAKNNLFEFWSREYIDTLADYIAVQLASPSSPPGGLTILELGAGDGCFTHHLTNALKTRIPDTTPWRAVATDVAPPLGALHVLQADFRSALTRFRPNIVLCSWMPQGQDWTAAFRQCPSVQQYILIGEVDDGCCGHPFLTWGMPPPPRGEHAPDGCRTDARDDALPPHVADGFERHHLASLSALQLARTTLLPSGASFSHTVAFVRRPDGRSPATAHT